MGLERAAGSFNSAVADEVEGVAGKRASSASSSRACSVHGCSAGTAARVGAVVRPPCLTPFSGAIVSKRPVFETLGVSPNADYHV